MKRQSVQDRDILRQLAENVTVIAQLPVQKETAQLWQKLNDLQPVRPMISIYQIPWDEFSTDEELQLQTTDPFCRNIEWKLRSVLYLWKHMRADMVIEPVLYSPLVIGKTDFGIQTERAVAKQNSYGIPSSHYKPQIHSEKDVEKIHPPKITFDPETTYRNYDTLKYLFGDILEIKQQGITQIAFNPWDCLIQWWGVQEAMVDLMIRPELVHYAMDRLTEAFLGMVNQWEEQHLLSFHDGNYHTGPGGLAYSKALPGGNFDSSHVRTHNLWGHAAAQIFSDVSPEMHYEFALKYERQWLDRCGLNYYGCCEPLHSKLDIIKAIPNIRKISMSPWANVDQFVEQCGDRYVLSHKPNPAVLAWDKWNVDQAKKELRDVLEKTKGCTVEVIMKDISTCQHQPHRLWEWCSMAKKMVQEYGFQ